MNSLPPTFNSAIFNTNAFSSGGFLTKSQADLLYMPYSSVSYLSYLYGVTPGIISASKAVIVDSNKDITGYRNITSTGSLSITGEIAFQGTSGINMNTNSISNCTTFTLSGIQTSSNTTASTSFSTGSLVLNGGIGIGLSTDATSSTNGGSFTTSGGMAIARKLFVGTDLSVGGDTTLSGSLTTSGAITSGSTITATISDTGSSTLVYPLTVQHLLSSGSPTDNAMEVGLKFQMPDSIDDPVDYGAISCEVQQHASGLQQGQLNFHTSFAGSLVNAMTLSSLTSPTNNILVLNGSTSLFSAYRLVCDNVLCNSNILISKATLPNLTITSTASNTLSLCYYNTDNQTWEIGARGSTASNPNSFYLYNSGYMYTINNTGITKFFNTDVSLTSTSNAFQVSGGLYAAKAILNNSYYNCNTINSGATSHTTSLQAICLNDQAIYFRSQNSGDTNHGIMYSKNANWNSGNGFGNSSTYKTDGPVIFGNEGVMIGNLNNTNTETICATFTGTTTNLAGNLNIAGPSINIAKVNINGPAGIGIINDSTHYANIGTDANGSVVLTATSGGSYSQYYFSYQNSLGLANLPPRSRLDFGNTFASCIITLYQANSSSGTYQIGCNNTAIEYTSNGSNGHQFYYNSTTTPQALGTNIFSIRGNGNVVSLKNMFAGSGTHAFGYDTTDLSSYGAGAHMHYAASKASFFGYDYSGGGYKDLSLNNDNLFIKSSSGYIGIQQTSPVCPLHVSTTANQTTAATFGFLSSGGSGTATGFTNRAFSIRSDGGIYVTAGEIDVTSDIRFKENINKIDDKLALDFITKIRPIVFNYKNAESNLHYGYSAQELVKNHFSVLVGSTQTDEPLDEQVLVNDEGESITIPSDTKLVVNLLATIPLLHKALQLGNERIKRNEEAIAELRELIKPAQEPAKLKRVVKKVKKPIVYKQ